MKSLPLEGSEAEAAVLAPFEEGAGKRDRKERLTEGEITPACDQQQVVSEDGELSYTLIPRLRHDAYT